MYVQYIENPYIKNFLLRGGSKKFIFWKFFISKAKMRGPEGELLTMSNFLNELSTIKSILDQRYGEDRWDFSFEQTGRYVYLKGIVIHYPELVITNGNGSRHTKKDFFVFVHVKLSEGKLKLANLEGFSTYCSLYDYMSNDTCYVHSHLRKFFISEITNKSSFCLGGDVEGEYLGSFFLKEQNQLSIELFFISIDNFMSQENEDDAWANIEYINGYEAQDTFLNYLNPGFVISQKEVQLVHENISKIVDNLGGKDFNFDGLGIYANLSDDTINSCFLSLLENGLEDLLIYKYQSKYITLENYLKYKEEYEASNRPNRSVIVNEIVEAKSIIFNGRIIKPQQEGGNLNNFKEIPIENFKLREDRIKTEIRIVINSKINEYIKKRQNKRLLEKRESYLEYSRSGL